MKIYAISDTHFGHMKLTEEHMGGRPADFGDRILDSISKHEGDLLIHCGDFAIGHDADHTEAFMLAAAGFKKKVLVRGNHDNQSDAWYYAHGWDFVCREFVQVYFGKLILFCHRPLGVEHKGGIALNVHGHLHGRGVASHRMVEGGTYDESFHFDLAPEIRNYGLVNLEKAVDGYYKVKA